MAADRPARPGAPSPAARGRRRPGPAAGAGLLGLTVLAGLVALGGTERPVDAVGAVPPARAAAPGEAPSTSDPGAVALLRRAEESSRELAWQGTQFVARWSGRESSSAVVDVLHVPGRGSLVRPAAAGTGAGTAVGTGTVPGTAPGAAAGTVAALVPEAAGRGPAAPLGLLQRHYVLREAGEGRCAGRATDVVEAWRRDALIPTPAARFWLDRETGLVLRREVVDPAGRTVLASAFLDLQAPPLDVPAGPRSAPATQPRLAPADPEALRAEGWPVPTAVAGLELHESRAGGAGPDRMVHLAYSDGLLGVSVFAQPGELDPEALGGWEVRRIGAEEVWVADSVPQRVAWTAGGTVFTVLADVPGGTLDEAVGALPHDDPGVLHGAASGVRERLARGLARAAEWVRPTAA